MTSSGQHRDAEGLVADAAALEPGRHLLVANASGIYAASADATYSGGFAATGGAIVVRPIGGQPIDAVGWGDATNAFVEGTAGAAPAAGSSIERRPGGPLRQLGRHERQRGGLRRQRGAGGPEPRGRTRAAGTAERRRRRRRPPPTPTPDARPSRPVPTPPSTRPRRRPPTPTPTPSPTPTRRPADPDADRRARPPTARSQPLARRPRLSLRRLRRRPRRPRPARRRRSPSRPRGSTPIGTTVFVRGVVVAEAGRLGTPPLLAIADATGGIPVRLPDGVAPPARGHAARGPGRARRPVRPGGAAPGERRHRRRRHRRRRPRRSP